MIYGVGTDIIEVARVEQQIKNNEGFKEKIFTSKEIEYCETKKNRSQNYAARFAAKEAFFKAIGTGWRGGLRYCEIEIMNDKLGKPGIVLHGKTKEYIANKGKFNINVSMSHVKTVAIATVILEAID
ncbi:MAG: holo-[acyl-carrier-protein] synthase [Candidatus Schekmanbacteria bacterium RBG_13_48_7]|uniref:Holo-[acyl-carrier-protein] synthase n=1 Tax=Candidatus Schekmanbacteria bacterium RBG_13_48_7 TaxID=1817878 RepID=A0A1F7RUJ1_9BACT|nr:MAG: holo-[acyl-carrier-protein] synthase [Candidatus Schekmanbacteria bacterium RBG_13_48_7]